MDFWTRNIFNVPRGTGSGFVWDKQGDIVTNNHVVAGASSTPFRAYAYMGFPCTFLAE